MRLKLELVPKTCWYTNVRSLVSRREWIRISNLVRSENKYICNICGIDEDSSGESSHCHEVWTYDFNNKIQTLKKLECLCPDCHNVKHWGSTSIRMSGNMDKYLKHACKINECSELDFKNHVFIAFNKWLEYSKYSWTVSLETVSKQYNIEFLKKIKEKLKNI